MLRVSAIVFMLCFPAPFFAMEPLLIPDDLAEIKIGKHIEFLEDPEGDFSIETLTHPLTSGNYRWIASQKDAIGFGYTHKVYWVRFSVKNPFDREATFFLIQGYPLIDEVALFLPEERGGFSTIRIGDRFPFGERAIKYRNPVFEIKIPEKGEATYYLRYQTTSSLNIPLSIEAPVYFYDRLNVELPIFWIYYGLLLSLIVYNIFLFVSIKDIHFLYYIFFVVFYMLFQMTLNGFAFQYLWPNAIWWANNSLPLFMCLAYFWGTQFGRSLMVFEKHLPRINTLLKFCQFLAVLGMILAMTAPYRVAIIFTTAFMVTVMITITTSFYLMVKGSRPAIFFAVSWGCMAFGITLFALKSFSILPHNTLTQWSIQIGSAIQAVLLAIVLTDQINDMRKKLQTLNINLEHKVMERTRDLQQTRDALWGEMQVAKKIQSVLLPKDPVMRGYEIAAIMVPAEEIGGDYYDVIHVEGRDWIVIGDVSGHGIPAGLIMMMVQTAIKTTLHQSPDIPPSQLLERINVTITQNVRQLQEDKYMTITVFACHENGFFRFSGLHQDIMVYRKNAKAVHLIETRGMWIGVEENIKGMFKNDDIHLDPGDIMMIYTDGVTEAILKESAGNASMFGEEKLKQILRDRGEEKAEIIKCAIMDALEQYRCADDTTFLVIKRLPS